RGGSRAHGKRGPRGGHCGAPRARCGTDPGAPLRACVLAARGSCRLRSLGVAERQPTTSIVPFMVRSASPNRRSRPRARARPTRAAARVISACPASVARRVATEVHLDWLVHDAATLPPRRGAERGRAERTSLARGGAK